MSHYTKKQLREKIKSEFDHIEDKQINLKSQKIQEQLFEQENFSQSEIYFVYLSNPKEVQTTNIIQKLLNQWKIVLVPKVIGDNMYPIMIKNLDSLKKWKYCLEPISEEIYKWKIEITLVPWLAFTKEWNRLWRWKSFYDRFFKDNPNIYKIWLWFDFQILDQIPVDSWDINMDLIIND